MPTRAEILRAAHAFLGTPYRHQASTIGAGCDCLGLVRGVWRMTIGPEPERLPPYTPDWAEGRDELLLAAFKRWLVPVEEAQEACVLVFRMKPDGPAKHAAILDADKAYLIHAYWGRVVVQSRFAPWWRARLAQAFCFPGVV